MKPCTTSVLKMLNFRSTASPILNGLVNAFTVPLLNATNQMLFLPSIQFTNAGLYSVVLSNPLGSVTNKSAQVVVNPAGVSLGMFPGVYVSGVVGYTYTIQASYLNATSG
jgi:hypothetical protein